MSEFQKALLNASLAKLTLQVAFECGKLLNGQLGDRCLVETQKFSEDFDTAECLAFCLAFCLARFCACSTACCILARSSRCALRRSSYWLRCSGVRWIISRTSAASLKADELKRCSNFSGGHFVGPAEEVTPSFHRIRNHSIIARERVFWQLEKVNLKPFVSSMVPFRLRRRKSLWIWSDWRSRIASRTQMLMAGRSSV